MATDRTPSKAQIPQDAQARREARLAEALRANLRRRKAEAAGKSQKTSEDRPTRPPGATDGEST